MHKSTCWKLVCLLSVLLIRIDARPKFIKIGKSFLKKKPQYHGGGIPVKIPYSRGRFNFDDNSGLKKMALVFNQNQNHTLIGYGTGDICLNYRNFSGNVYGIFRCPLVGFSFESKSCCGKRNSQYCCTQNTISLRSSFEANRRMILRIGIAIILVVVVLYAIVKMCIRRYHHQQKIYQQGLPTENNE